MFPNHLVGEWSAKNEHPITVYTLDSGYRACWICSKGHEWQTRIIDRTRKNKKGNCPQCFTRAREDKLEDYPRLVAEWSDKNELSISNYRVGSSQRVWWICSRRHEWQATIDARTRKDRPTACPKCFGHAPRQDKLTDHPHLVAEWSPKNNLPISEYKSGSGYRA